MLLHLITPFPPITHVLHNRLAICSILFIASCALSAHFIIKNNNESKEKEEEEENVTFYELLCYILHCYIIFDLKYFLADCEVMALFHRPVKMHCTLVRLIDVFENHWFIYKT